MASPYPSRGPAKPLIARLDLQVIPGKEAIPIYSKTSASKEGRSQTGFSLLELLVAMTVTGMVLVLLMVMVQSTNDIWQKSTGRAKAFATARAAFESISRTIGAATLNTYQDYFDAARERRASGDLNFSPDIYGRFSDLHFVTGNDLVNGQEGGAVFFTAPFDFDTGVVNPSTGGQLNGIGFFVRFGPDPSLPPFITNNPSRYRLYQFLQPTRFLKTMNSAFPDNQWFTSDVNATPPLFVFPLATNVVAFAVLPKLSELEDENESSLTTDYSYDTRMDWSGGAQPANMHQLPPVVRVVMVVLDERSAARIENGNNPPDLGFEPSAIFDNPSELEDHLEDIAEALTEEDLNFRIFRADIPLRTAKWSVN